MERVVLAFLCLSAAFCFASAQDLPRCPDDWLTFYAKYQRGNYAQQSQPLLVDQQCTYEVTLSFGPFVVTPTISICTTGTVSRFVAPSPLGGVYICETLRPAADQPELAPLVVPLNADIGGSASGPAVSEATESPTRPASVTPTEQAERPTTEGELSECPSDGVYSRNNYIYSSLGLTVEVDCFIRTRVQGSAGQQKTSVWECNEGYKREFVRRNQFRCVQQ